MKKIRPLGQHLQMSATSRPGVTSAKNSQKTGNYGDLTERILNKLIAQMILCFYGKNENRPATNTEIATALNRSTQTTFPVIRDLAHIEVLEVVDTDHPRKIPYIVSAIHSTFLSIIREKPHADLEEKIAALDWGTESGAMSLINKLCENIEKG